MKTYCYGSLDSDCIIGDKPMKSIISIESSKDPKYSMIYKYYVKLPDAEAKKHNLVLLESL